MHLEILIRVVIPMCYLQSHVTNGPFRLNMKCADPAQKYAELSKLHAFHIVGKQGAPGLNALYCIC